MVKPRTREENAAYQRKYRRDQKLKRMQSMGLVDVSTESTGVSTKPSTDARNTSSRDTRTVAGIDCSLCGHDRDYYHAGACTCPTGPDILCGCRRFSDPEELF